MRTKPFNHVLQVNALWAYLLLLAICVSAYGEQNSTSAKVAERKNSHWAWKPIVVPDIPKVEGSPGISAIDRFLLKELRQAGLKRAAAADKRSLIRRATFDLIGLPPTPQEVAAFENDSSDAAFAKVIDRLLASPYFGERWARHWLDVVRYSETLGHEFDYPLTDPWRYRDYVIRALNDDLPYNQFVREQIAGDLINPPRRHPTEQFNESIIATAFWYMGEATHAPVDTRADQSTRIENQVDVVSKAFLGLTVACARCHDHKFDAISTKDYYALAGYIASSHQQVALLDEGGRIDAGFEQLTGLEQRGKSAARNLPGRGGAEAADLFARYLLAAGHADGIEEDAARNDIAHRFQVDRELLNRLDAAIKEARNDASNPLHAWSVLAAVEGSGNSFENRRRELAAQLADRQAQRTFARRDQAVFEDFNGDFSRWFPTGWSFGTGPTVVGDWMAESAGPRLLAAGLVHSGRYGVNLQGVIRSSKFTIDKPFIHYRLASRSGKIRVIVDGYTMDNFSPLLVEGLSFDVNTEGKAQWYAQSVARHLGHRAHIELVDHNDGFIAVDEIRFADSEETPPPSDSIGNSVLSRPGIDGPESLARAYGDVWAESVTDWRKGRPTAGAEFVRWALTHQLAPEEASYRAELDDAAVKLKTRNASLPSPAGVVAIADGSGEDLHVQIGGSYKRVGELAPRQLLAAIAGANQSSPPHGSGRLELADRILSADNPFPARVMANRIWAHLFGRGIVATVDNFGVLGQRPTHPELLDYLATRFRDSGWSVKKLIREIMLSDAYQFLSASEPASNEQDPENRLLHRANVRRLEGEVVRDALLAISGRLDAAQFGPSIPIHLTSFMEGRGRPKESGPLDGAGRRSIYVEVRRNFLSPMMLAYDTPAPASCVGQRTNSNVPAQALIMMNDPFVVEQCRLWAERTLAERAAGTAERITQLYWAAFSRPPVTAELQAAKAFLIEQARLYETSQENVRVWADLCHVLVNVKEFIFLD